MCPKCLDVVMPEDDKPMVHNLRTEIQQSVSKPTYIYWKRMHPIKNQERLTNPM